MTEPARGSLVVDTSAAVAVILGEPGSEELAVYLENALARLMPAAIRVELGIVIEARLWPAGQDVVDRFFRDAKIDIVSVDADLAAIRQGAAPGGAQFRRLLHLRAGRADRAPRTVHGRRLRRDGHYRDAPSVGVGRGLTAG